ncbi:MAG: ADP-ribosylation factor-like protein [Candidatus Hodarchaeota archaeon]
MNESKACMHKSKILLLGLDNSGKSSILISLQSNSNLLSHFSLNPTRGVNRQTIESEDLTMSIWDCGGQSTYRQEHLQNFPIYKEGVEKIIYVIDIQDKERYELALEFLKDLLDLIEEHKLDLKFSIFLHKYDPNLKKQEGFESIDDVLATNLIPKIKSLMPSNMTYDIYKTSIFTVFQKELA